jgi:hypothetical protein
MENSTNCFNCKAAITEKDRAIFKAQLWRADYRDNDLNFEIDVCACCNNTMILNHNRHADIEAEYDYCEY